MGTEFNVKWYTCTCQIFRKFTILFPILWYLSWFYSKHTHTNPNCFHSSLFFVRFCISYLQPSNVTCYYRNRSNSSFPNHWADVLTALLYYLYYIPVFNWISVIWRGKWLDFSKKGPSHVIYFFFDLLFTVTKPTSKNQNTKLVSLLHVMHFFVTLIWFHLFNEIRWIVKRVKMEIQISLNGTLFWPIWL